MTVGYRTAREYRFPTQIEDSWEALRWIIDNESRFGMDKTRMAVAGESAGGRLVAVIAQGCRDTGIKLCLYNSVNLSPIKNNPKGLAPTLIMKGTQYNMTGDEGCGETQRKWGRGSL
jgi:acetyl esterase/lipase